MNPQQIPVTIAPLDKNQVDNAALAREANRKVKEVDDSGIIDPKKISTKQW